jgi:hypothetical protein
MLHCRISGRAGLVYHLAPLVMLRVGGVQM